jgi:hypothetical protein
MDGDGAFNGLGGEDCDDTDPEVHRGAGENCGDGVDNDCDGVIDEDDDDCRLIGNFAPDDDGDGYSQWLDCDDGDASVHPGAYENCLDGVDNDCDGAADWEDTECNDLVGNG